jgi:hypothetical protein
MTFGVVCKTEARIGIGRLKRVFSLKNAKFCD